MVPTLSQINPVHTIPSYLSETPEMQKQRSLGERFYILDALYYGQEVLFETLFRYGDI
jgi:hypothetical protein